MRPEPGENASPRAVANPAGQDVLRCIQVSIGLVTAASAVEGGLLRLDALSTWPQRWSGSALLSVYIAARSRHGPLGAPAQGMGVELLQTPGARPVGHLTGQPVTLRVGGIPDAPVQLLEPGLGPVATPGWSPFAGLPASSGHVSVWSGAAWCQGVCAGHGRHRYRACGQKILPSRLCCVSTLRKGGCHGRPTLCAHGSALAAHRSTASREGKAWEMGRGYGTIEGVNLGFHE